MNLRNFHRSVFKVSIIIISLITLLIFPIRRAYSQTAQIKNLSSIVLSSVDSSGVEFVHVQIENTGIGTITNTAGEFALHITDSIYNIYPSLLLSCIGYKSKTIDILTIEKNKTFYDTIFLEPEATYLKEVIVTANKKDTLDIFIAKVIDKMRDNYINRNYYAKGFFRQVSQKGDSASRLIEAAIDIRDVGYFKRSEKIKIRVNQLRKSNDYVRYSWIKSLYKLAFGTQNDIIETYNSDLLRPDKVLTKKDGLNDFKDFRLDSIVGERENTIACISFISYRNGDSILLYHSGKLFVNLKDLAILRIEYSWTPNPNAPLPNKLFASSFYNGICRTRKVVEYQKVGSKYYPLFISVFEPIDGAIILKGNEAYKESIILLNNIDNKPDNSRIRNKEKEDRGEDVYEKEFPFNPEFWKTYNTVVINPLKDKDRFSLERKQNLNEQFNKNGYRGKKK